MGILTNYPEYSSFFTYHPWGTLIIKSYRDITESTEWRALSLNEKYTFALKYRYWIFEGIAVQERGFNHVLSDKGISYSPYQVDLWDNMKLKIEKELKTEYADYEKKQINRFKTELKKSKGPDDSLQFLQDELHQVKLEVQQEGKVDKESLRITYLNLEIENRSKTFPEIISTPRSGLKDVKNNLQSKYERSVLSLPDIFKDRKKFSDFINHPLVQKLYTLDRSTEKYSLIDGMKENLAAAAIRLREKGWLINNNRLKSNQELAEIFLNFFNEPFDRKIGDKSFQRGNQGTISKKDHFTFIVDF